MCYRDTTTVLWNPQDWLYICDAHLTDPGFATLVGEPAPQPAAGVKLSEDELKKIKDEWEAKEKKRKEKEEASKKTTDATTVASTSTSSTSTPVAAPVVTPAAPAPTHQKYTLHRHIFTMRLNDLKKRRQTSQANAIAPRLPVVPKNLSWDLCLINLWSECILL